MRTLALALLCLASTAHADSVQDTIEQARAAFQKGDTDRAVQLLDELVKAHPEDARAFAFRGTVRETLKQHEGAVADFSASLKIDPKQAELFNRRGSEQFRLGRIKESVEDFDRFLELRPSEYKGHWQRGISLYYLVRFDDGRKQFAGYEKVSTTDVENTVWHYLCNVHVVGKDQARKEMLKTGTDRRVPMMVVLKLFKGEATPADVLAATEAGRADDDERKQRRFYAHLYLGLYHESEGDKTRALEHLKQAATTYHDGHYMADVARVHVELLTADKVKK